MILYNGQLKEQDVKYKVSTRKGKKVKKSLDILTFDIEVTSAWKDPKRGLIAYEPGRCAEYWNELERYALCYVWQFSYNDAVYYGRDLKEFKRVLDDLPADKEFIIWVHNLAYEFQFLLNIMTVRHVFARTPHKPMYVIFEEYPNITFKCSYILTNLSLDAWGKQLGVKKLVGDLDYNKIIRTPLTELSPAELDYCERDCIVVYEGIKEHLIHYKDVWDIPNTSTGKIRRVIKKRVTNDKEYMSDIKKCIPTDAREYKLLQDVFAGGYTHSNRKYTGKVCEAGEHVDIASSYPFSMFAYKYPYNKWCYYGRTLPDPSTFEYRAYIIKLHFTGLRCISWNTYISSAKSRGRNMLYDNGRVLTADELYITVTEQDYITICNNYEWDSVESEGTWICHKRYLPTIFVDYLLQLYEDKTTLKGFPAGSVESQKYAISKQYTNSMFGMMVTALFNAMVMFNIDRDIDQWYIDPLTDDIVNNGLDKMRRWFDKKYFLSYSVGCWITAYSRRRLWEVIELIDSKVYYCDTDSAFYKGSYDWSKYNAKTDKLLKDACLYHGFDIERTRPRDLKGVCHPLGHLDREPDFDKFKSLGAKKYVEQRDGQLYMTVAGINKAAVECLGGDINNFQDGFIFDKDRPSVKKLEHTYLSDMQPIIYPDGFYSDYKYGINLRPTGYKLSVPTVYDNMEYLYNYCTKPNENEIIRRRGTF